MVDNWIDNNADTQVSVKNFDFMSCEDTQLVFFFALHCDRNNGGRLELLDIQTIWFLKSKYNFLVKQFDS